MLQLHSNNFGLKQLSITIKTFHYYGTGVQSCFKVIKIVCIAVYFLVIVPVHVTFFDVILYLIIMVITVL